MRPKSAPGQLWRIKGVKGSMTIRILHQDLLPQDIPGMKRDYFVWAPGPVAEDLDRIIERECYEFVGMDTPS